jgi:hypothetical protein
MPKQHAPKSLTSLFTKSEGTLAAIAEKGQYLNALNHHLIETVGATIATNCRVSNYNNQGGLTIETINSAFATRLNFMLPQILQNFRQNVLPQIASIKIKVVPNEKFYCAANKKPPINTNRLSEQASDYILEAASHAPDSLKRKLERLAACAKKKV